VVLIAVRVGGCNECVFVFARDFLTAERTGNFLCHVSRFDIGAAGPPEALIKKVVNF
jgi:hypothetical protein